MLQPIVETVHEESEEESEEEFDQTPEERDESWFPRQIYNVSASGTYESRTDLLDGRFCFRQINLPLSKRKSLARSQ